MAEVVKYGMIWDSALFDLLEREGSKVTPPTSGELDFALMSHIIRRCCEIKAEVVSKDERESGLREILNFGHTVGHALEAATEYGLLLHGEAVALGMLVETLLAERRGMVSSEVSVRLCRLLVDLGLPVELPSCDLGQIWSLMHSDKKAREGSIRMVLPIGIGQVETVAGISQDELVAAWKGTS
jgi:3-dehydroquinate synthase